MWQVLLVLIIWSVCFAGTRFDANDGLIEGVELMDILGRGRYAVVYKAKTKDDKWLAVKVGHSALENMLALINSDLAKTVDSGHRRNRFARKRQ